MALLGKPPPGPRAALPPPPPLRKYNPANPKLPDSPNFRPGIDAPSYDYNPKTGIGTVTGAKKAPRANVRAGVPDKAPPPLSKPLPTKGTPSRANVTVTPTKTTSAKPTPVAPTTPTTPTRVPAATSPTSYGMTPQQLATLSQSWAKQELSALTQPYEDAISQANTQSAQHAQAIQGFATALASLLRPVGGNVTGAYGQAADAVAGYGQGFSQQNQALKDAAGANAAGANPALTAEQQASIKSGYAGTPYDVMYGVNGYDPATSLRQLGTGLGALYDKLPEVAGSYGQEWLGSAQATALKNLQTLQQQEAEQKGKYPQLLHDAYTTLSDQDMKRQSLNATLQYAGLRNRATEAGITGTDPVTGLPTPATQRLQHQEQHDQQTLALAQKKYKIQLGQLGLSSDRLKLAYAKMVQTRQEKGKLHGLTQNEYQVKQSKAAGLARAAHKPYTDKSGQVHPAVSWQQYLDGGLAKGVPFWILIEQGKRVYSKDEIRLGLIPAPKKK